MKIIKSFVYLFLLVAPLTIIAQNNNKPVCGTDLYYQRLCEKYPSILRHQEEAENMLLIQNSPMEGMAVTKIVPVVFHIIHINGTENIPDSYVQDQIKQLNEDYRKKNSNTSQIRTQFQKLAEDLNIEFRLARIDPQGKCTNGITRYYSDLTVNANDNVKSLPGQYWDSKKYLNVWVVSSINSSGSIGTILGYSYFPWMVTSNPTIDGVLIRADRIGTGERTLTHEIGHYMGLYHTFQDGCGNSNCSNNGDKVCDTPPVADMNFGCNKTSNTCSTESPDQYDMLENYMDYTDCTCMFTKGQGSRVQSMIANYRANLYSTSNLQLAGVYDTTNVTCKVVAGFTADPLNICAGSTVNFINTSLTSSNVQYQWEFPGGNPSVSFQKNPSVTYPTSGKYDVKLIVKNSISKDSMISKEVAVIYPQTGFNTPFYESFESADLTNDYWVLGPPVENIAWYRTNKSAVTGSYSFFVNNFQCQQKDLIVSFTLPPVNFTGLTAPLITFKHAFAAQSATHTDKLKVYASDDCGITWYPRYTKSQLNLPTTQTYYTTEFIPNNPELWDYNTVDLSFFQNKPNVLIRFDFTTGLGNNLYIDDIRIGLVTSIEKNSASANNISIYPNPASEVLYLKLPDAGQDEYAISINDLLGNILYTGNHTANQNDIFTVNLKKAGILKNGTYLIRVISKDKIITKLFTVSE